MSLQTPDCGAYPLFYPSLDHQTPPLPSAFLGAVGGRFYWKCCLSWCFLPKQLQFPPRLCQNKGGKCQIKGKEHSVLQALVMSPGKEDLPVPRHSNSSLGIFSFLLLISHLSLSTSRLPEQCHNTNNCRKPPTAKWCQWQGNNTVSLSHGICWVLGSWCEADSSLVGLVHSQHHF